jgi:hypothetical protein
MGLALANRSVQGQIRLQYIICLDFYVFTFLGATGSDEAHNGMQPHLEATRNKYKSYITKALEDLTILTAPSMTMLQASISGVGILCDFSPKRNPFPYDFYMLSVPSFMS